MTDVNRTDATATADADGVMSTAGQQAFETELRRLRASNTGGPLDQRVATLGVVLSVVGLVTVLVAYTQATGFDDYRDQMESLILAVFGLGLVGFGAALYVRSSLARFLRYWLLRVVYEQRDLRSPAAVPSPSPNGSTPAVPADAGDAPVGTVAR